MDGLKGLEKVSIYRRVYPEERVSKRRLEGGI